MTHAIAVLTREPTDEIIAQGGTGHWVTSRNRAAEYPYVVCVRNRNHPSSPDDAPHHAAVLIGRVAGATEVAKTEHGQPRVFIRMSAYALINVPGAWGKTRNPVWYTTLEELGIDLESLHFEPMSAPPDQPEPEPETGPGSLALSIAEAKEALAAFYGVPASSVTITIQG